MGAFIDILDKRFGSLTVIQRAGSDKNKNATWICRCDCGKTKTFRSTHLRSGEASSCGCQRTKRIARARTTHGLSDKAHPLHKKYERERRLPRVYGITAEQYHEMLSQQNQRCGICNLHFDDCGAPHVDHCHQSGKVRGLLCRKCNTAIGLLGDNAESAMRAHNYLKEGL